MEALNGLWSPRLIALQEQLKKGNRSALQVFWEQVFAQGTPHALESNRMMRDVLRELEYEVHYAEYPGGHDLLWGAAPVAEALKMLTGKSR